jgi:transcriptional regulator with PAS, ATPase and Fis domain
MDRAALVGQLKQAPVFRRLRLGELDRVLSLSRIERFAPKAVVIEAGRPGSEVFVLLRGRVSIRAPLSSEEDRVIALRGAGEWVGEMALLDGLPRSARVVAEEEVHALRLSREAFEALASCADATLELMRSVSQRLREADAFHLEALREKREALLGESSLEAPTRPPGKTSSDRSRIDAFVGTSERAEGLREAARVAAASALPVMLVGETGTGKELLARAIHAASARSHARFVPVNCGILSETLLETTLFGQARGAFTGAVGAKAGLVEEAHGGTLFLDELSEMPAAVQAAMLRFLDGGEYRRLGETRVRHADVRVIAALPIPPEEAAATGQLRADLRFRIDVVRIELPLLRERREDLGELIGHLAGEVAGCHGGPTLRFAPEAVDALAAHDFPGNVRELRNEVERLHARLGAGARVGVADLGFRRRSAGAAAGKSYPEAVRAFKSRTIREALASSHGNVTRAAERLGVHRSNLSRMIRDLEIET